MQALPSSAILRHLNSHWRDYLQLIKPQDTLLFLLTALTALIVAGEQVPTLSTMVLTLFGGGLAAAGAGILNSYYDRDIDTIMTRTRNRPLPAERIEPRQALRLGIAFSVASSVVLWLGVNWIAAAISLFGLLTYIYAYTRWLKRKSIHNVYLAAFAWAVPPLVGWAAATGNLSVAALSLFAIIFYWTPVNFWALGLMRLTDFTKAGIPILPVIKGGLTTRKQIVYYSILLVIISLLPAAIGMMGFIYAEVALLLGGLLVFVSLDLFRHPSLTGAARVYKYSQVYLILIFVTMMLDRTLFY